MAGTIRKVAQMAHVSPVMNYPEELRRQLIRLVMCQIIQHVSQMV